MKGIMLNVVRCVVKEDDVLEYARLFSVIVGKEKRTMNRQEFKHQDILAP